MISKVMFGACAGFAALVAMALPLSQSAQAETPPVAAPAIHIDVPVKMKEAKIVFNMDHRAFAGDMPVGMKYMMLSSTRLPKVGTVVKIVGVFHGDAGYMLLNDQKYDAVRGVKTGNPYKGVLKALADHGVEIEECFVTMTAHHWTNSDLLPMVKVNSGAVARIVQLVQEGYVQIQP